MNLNDYLDQAVKRGRPKKDNTIKNPEKAKNISEEVFNRFLSNPRFTYKGKTEEYKKAFKSKLSISKQMDEQDKARIQEIIAKVEEGTDGYVNIDGILCKKINNEFRAILKQGTCGESYFKWWIRNYRLINELTGF